METLIPILAAAIRSGTPVLYAVLGELLTERAGVMNLGLEGVMLVGAFAGFSTTRATGNPYIGLLAAFAAGCLIVLIHAFLTISMGTNQVVSGLALSLFGSGLSALLGRNYIGETISGINPAPLFFLGDIPLIGPIFFRHDFLVYLSYALIPFLCWFLFRTRAGMNLRAVAAGLLVLAATAILLETGVEPHVDAAHRLYRARGFGPGPPFADYAADPNSAYLRLELVAD